MAKNAKKPTANTGKPITAFFTRASKGPQPSSSQDAPTSSQLSGAASPPSRNSFHKNEASNSTLSNGSTTALASGSRATGIMSPRRSERKVNVQLPSVSSAASLKRSRSPDAQYVTRPATPISTRNNSENPKTPERRKSKFDSDSSEPDSANAVIYVKSTPNPQMRKKARLSSPVESSTSSTAEFVPSSQSDEEELASTEVRRAIANAIPNERKKQVLPLTPDQDDAMEIDEDESASGPSSSRNVESKALQQPFRGSQTMGQTLTPPLSDRPSAPPTPVALDQASKTAKIIADIKARAYAKCLSSPEPSPLKFNDVLESSDEEDLPDLSIPSKKPEVTKAQGANTRPATRYSLRNRSPSPMELRRSTTKTVPQAKPSRKASSAVPFAVLLKEKKQAERRGNDDAALHRAEETSLKYGELLDEMGEDEDEDEADRDSSNISSGGMRNVLKARTLRRESSDPEISIGREDRKRLFGDVEDGGEGILSILESDKAARRNTATSEKASGIQLWKSRSDMDDSAMMVDERLELPGRSAIIRLTNAAFQRGDIVRATALLNMNLISAINIADRDSVASSLCEIALSSQSSLVAEAAVRVLENFWSSPATQPTTSTISFAAILASLKRLWVDVSMLPSHWQLDDQAKIENTAISPRNEIISRIIVLVTACARARRLRKEEIPDFVLALILIGMDTNTPPDILRDISQVIEVAIVCLSSEGSISRDNEFSLSLKLLDCAAPFEPINKLRLVALLSNGSGGARRVADFIAYCIITDKPSPTVDLYTDTPPLNDVIEQLMPYSRSDPTPPGKFAIHGATDYIDLGFYITILSIAVSNVKDYALKEQQTSRLRNAVPESSFRSREKSKTGLLLLQEALGTLHSGISDTRATDLDRSRTKASIKGLELNLYYQRETWTRNNPQGKAAGTMHHYFKKS